ncbi:hypothetical protein EXIGLDRAFT_759220 [Exidia glandulosa HHB12029]|uniref:Uncharacterized protein n=1 Tax=Exidia glandulosa HHB12029 TaxID=1314781 RepID=A0A165QB73_EXIGL|nr:hypothetical protein EXIGLDRAFT_759220 [Exidia glandulosa HHB12029]
MAPASQRHALLALATRDTGPLIDALVSDPGLAQRVASIRTCFFPYTWPDGSDQAGSLELLWLCPNVVEAYLEQDDLPKRMYRASLLQHDGLVTTLHNLTRLKLTHRSQSNIYRDTTEWRGAINGLFDVFMSLPALKELDGAGIPGCFDQMTLPTPPFQLERLRWMKHAASTMDSGSVHIALIACSSGTLRDLEMDLAITGRDALLPVFAIAARRLKSFRVPYWTSYGDTVFLYDRLLPCCSVLQHLSVVHYHDSPAPLVATLTALRAPLHSLELYCNSPPERYHGHVERLFLRLLRSTPSLRMLRTLSLRFDSFHEDEDDLDATLEMVSDLRTMMPRLDAFAILRVDGEADQVLR